MTTKSAHSTVRFTVYHYPACGTCRKALAWLAEHGLKEQATLVDITQSPPTAGELLAFAQRAGVSLRKFFNTSGQSYRAGDWKAKLDAGLSEEEMARALAADGKLIKRPLLVPDDESQPVLVGFKPDAYAEQFGQAS